MKKLTSKKSLEFLTIMTAVVGTMVGAGIYVKNDNHTGHVLGIIQNPYMALIAWVIIGIIVMAAIMVFMEVASSTAEKGNGTVSNWTRLFWNRKVGSIISIYYIFIYLPVNYGFFAVLIIQYVMAAAGNPITNKGDLVALYLVVGILFIVCFSYMNSFQRATGKKVQIIGTFVKFIPLILVFIAIFVPNTTWAVIFNKAGAVATIGKDGTPTVTGNPYSTSFEDFTAMRLFSGFVPILFAFNGFIYAANMQKETENKDVVAKGILVGVIFTTIFYIIISVSLFLGSTDGSVVSFFNYLFNGLHKNVDITTIKGTKMPYIPTNGVAVVLSNVILACVCLMGLNSYTLTGTNFYNTDANEGIIFSNNKFIKQGASGLVQMTMGLVAFIPLTVIAIFTGHETDPGYYMDLAGNAGAVLAFTAYTLLLILAVINRFTNKVEVKKLKGWLFWTCAPFSIVTLVFIDVYSYLDFFGAFSKVDGGSPFSLANVLAMGISIGIIALLWIINEIAFKLKPFDQEKVNKQEAVFLESKSVKKEQKEQKQYSLSLLETRQKQVAKELDIIISANKKQKASKDEIKLLKSLKQERLNNIKKELKEFKRKR